MTYLIIIGVVSFIVLVVLSIRHIATNEMPADPWCECDEHDYGTQDLIKGRRFLICRECGFIEDRGIANEM